MTITITTRTTRRTTRKPLNLTRSCRAVCETVSNENSTTPRYAVEYLDRQFGWTSVGYHTGLAAAIDDLTHQSVASPFQWRISPCEAQEDAPHFEWDSETVDAFADYYAAESDLVEATARGAI